MSEDNINTKRREVIQKGALSGAFLLGSTKLGSAKQPSAEQVHLVETGYTYRPEAGEIVNHDARMPRDGKPKYYSNDNRLITTDRLEHDDRLALETNTAVVSSGRDFYDVGERIESSESKNYLPLDLYQYQIPVDAISLAEAHTPPAHTTRMVGTDVVIPTRNGLKKVPAGRSTQIELPSRSFTVQWFERGEKVEGKQVHEGGNESYKYVEKTDKVRFTPVLNVRNSGKVDLIK